MTLKNGLFGTALATCFEVKLRALRSAARTLVLNRLVQDKGMSASLARKVRSTFGRLAANALRRHRNNIATLPYSIKNVDGNPTRVTLEQSRTFTYL